MPGMRKGQKPSDTKRKRVGAPAVTSSGGVGSRAKPGTAPSSKRGGEPARKARAYLAKSSGTTKGEVRGVLQAVRKGTLSKGGAIKVLKGGPRAGVPAGNKKKVAKAIRRAR